MNKEIILTPEELFFMGRLLQAKYIDYAYVAAMNDINQNFALFETEAKAKLVSAGILMEDFGGNVEVDPSALDIFKPIFFGEIETSIDICNIGETNMVTVNKYHFHDGAITMVTGDNGKLVIKAVDQIAINEFISTILSDQYKGTFAVVNDLNNDKISRFIAVKSIIVGHTAIVKTYIESDNVLYRENEGNIESITRDMFIADAYDVVKGV